VLSFQGSQFREEGISTMKNGRLSDQAVTKPDFFPNMMIPRRVWRRIACIALGLFLGGFSHASATLPPGFTETQYGSNLVSGASGSPTAMAFSPDGRLFVCLQGGQLRVIKNGTLLATPFVSLTVDSFNERGLLGVAFDPNFATNQFVYVYYTVPGSPAHNRVSRFTANGDVAGAGSEAIILDLDNLTSAGNHNGGAIHFGPDGKLYIAVGENANAANAQSLNNRLGKMLRINADGSIPADNPASFPGIAGSPSGANRAIWSVGLRNPFTFAFQPGTGRMFINDVGAGTFEEINDGIVGSNYGWSICEGACTPPNANYRDPLFQYGRGGGICAITGGTFYNPPVSQFPASYVGKYFFSDFCGNWIRLFDPSNSTATDFATDLAAPVDLQVGADGSLYYLIRGNGGQVWKVSATVTATPAQAVNLSTRMFVQTGANVGIGGFIIAGSAPKHVLLRAIGPSLTQFGVANPLADPVMELNGPAPFATITNNDWRDDPAQEAAIQATGIAPSNNLESAIDTTLNPGAYTAVVSGRNSTSGVGLIELYDLSQAVLAKLANISTRAFVNTGDNIVIAGFQLGGHTGADRIVLRGIGPSLTGLGVTNPLANPTLELRDNNGALLVSNNDWQDNPAQAAELTAAGLAPTNPLESGIAATLPPGLYTALLAGLNNGTGIGVVEVYDRNAP
jgi:glucose/arabinose dehydrogenase